MDTNKPPSHGRLITLAASIVGGALLGVFLTWTALSTGIWSIRVNRIEAGLLRVRDDSGFAVIGSTAMRVQRNDDSAGFALMTYEPIKGWPDEPPVIFWVIDRTGKHFKAVLEPVPDEEGL